MLQKSSIIVRLFLQRISSQCNLLTTSAIIIESKTTQRPFKDNKWS